MHTMISSVTQARPRYRSRDDFDEVVVVHVLPTVGFGDLCANLYPVLMSSAESILHTLTGISWGAVADWLTIIAFVSTVIGLVSAILARGKLHCRVYTDPSSRSFTWTLSNAGANPVQQIQYHPTWITRTGRPVAGDGSIPLVQTLFFGEQFRVEIFDPEDQSWGGDERPNELRMPSPQNADGAVVVLSWRNPLIPWTRRLQVRIFMFGKPAIELYGRRARKIARDMADIGPDSCSAAILGELTIANGGVTPVEQSVQERYPRERSRRFGRMSFLSALRLDDGFSCTSRQSYSLTDAWPATKLPPPRTLTTPTTSRSTTRSSS